jgi:3-methyladenine DNA glycosylase AlkD
MQKLSLTALKRELRALGNPTKAANSLRFFKCAPGQYGAGDMFLGLTVPEQRTLSKKYHDLLLLELENLLQSKEHEFRLTALMILVSQYQKGDSKKQKEIVALYQRNTHRINNWDLVDASAHYILGDHLLKTKTEKQALAILTKLAKSPLLWERRIAMVSTWAFIRAKNPEPTFILSRMLLDDTEDLMHKAVGWMLREVGKYCGQATLSQFLDEYASKLPRTALRYSLEHYDEKKRQHYMKQKQAPKK